MERRSFLASSAASVPMFRGLRNDRGTAPSRSTSGAALTVEASRSSTVVGTPVSVRASGGSGAYEWSVRESPDGSEATVRDSSGQVTSVTPDTSGSYVVELSSGGESADVSFEVGQRTDLVDRFAPRLHFHQDTEYKPTRLEALVENSHLRSGDQTVTESPSLFDLSGRDSSHYLELQGSESDYPGYQEAYPPTVYANVVRGTDYDGTTYDAVVYWFVYTYDPKHGFAGFGAHQGDVESLVVLVDDSGEGAYLVPNTHGGMTILPFEQAASDGTHPDVYPEHRSHVSFLRDTGEYDGDGFQTYSFWSDASADCGALDSTASAFHSEWTGSSETWAHDGSADTEYELVELTGDEVWSDYAGGLSDEAGSITIPQQRNQYDDPGSRAASRGCPDHEQVSGQIAYNSHQVDSQAGSAVVGVEITNDGGKPHPYWVTIAHADGGAVASRQVRVGTANPSVFDDGQTRSETIEFEPPSGASELVAELWLHPPDVRRNHDFEDETSSFTIEA